MGFILIMNYCFFEQSGTFKEVFQDEGFEAVDVDIENRFGKTDLKIDLFEEIEKAFVFQNSIFDRITKNDFIIAFFPCTFFSVQNEMIFRMEPPHLRGLSDEEKIVKAIERNNERTKNYSIFCKFIAVCKNKQIPLIIENPYNKNHFLVKYYFEKAQVIDFDRTEHGDRFTKPTQFWFFNINQDFVVFSATKKPKKQKNITNCSRFERSLISKDYARWFLRNFVLCRKSG